MDHNVCMQSSLHRQPDRRAQRSGQRPAETGKPRLPRKGPATRQYGCNGSQGFKARPSSFGHDGMVLGPIIGAFGYYSDKELELELIQTQMTQKVMLRAEVYARALRASQNRE